jgi:signal transduction histidine kinase
MAPWLAMLDLAPERIWLLDAGHRILWTNRAGRQIFGLPLEEIVALDPATFGEAHAVLDVAERATALAGSIAHWSGWAVYPDGNRRYTERTFLPFHGASRHGPLYFEFTVDQTELMLERERAEAAERRLIEALRALPDGLAVEDSGGHLVLCNEPYARSYGRKPEEMIGLSFAERASMLAARCLSLGDGNAESDPKALLAQLLRLRRTDDSVHFRAADGREVLVRRANTSDGGRIIVHSDLTALRDTWDILSDVFEACPTPILVSRASDMEVRMANGAARSMLAIADADASTGWGIDWEQPSERDGLVQKLRSDGRAEGVEARFRRRDGMTLWLSIWARLATIRDETVVIATATDVTGERAEREALHEAWDRVSSVIEACPTPLVMVRASDGVIIYMNRTLKELMRLGDLEDGASIAPYWQSAGDRAEYLAVLRSEGRVDGWEHVFKCGDGSEVSLALWSRLAEFRGEEVVVTTPIDLTETRAREAERAHERRQLEEAEKLAALGEMLSGIAHELNNPLSVLAGQAVLLEETATDEATRRRALHIAEQAERCARTVRSFLDLARERPLEQGAVDLADVLSEAIEMTRSEWEPAGVRIDRTDAEAPHVVRGDADRLRQVVVNLIVNAVQAMAGNARPSCVTLSSEADAALGVARLTVADTGPGVPAELRERIFQPFFSTKGSGGSGIGLALCRRIVATHGGRINVEAPSGGGAAFIVELPLHPGLTELETRA